MYSYLYAGLSLFKIQICHNSINITNIVPELLSIYNRNLTLISNKSKKSIDLTTLDNEDLVEVLPGNEK